LELTPRRELLRVEDAHEKKEPGTIPGLLMIINTNRPIAGCLN